MIGLVLVTHGRLAEEFIAATEHVVGPQRAAVVGSPHAPALARKLAKLASPTSICSPETRCLSV
jgi:mannose/fructose-specific phosphotransferase system component IIA